MKSLTTNLRREEASTSLSLYLREIGAYPLLTPEEQAALGDDRTACHVQVEFFCTLLTTLKLATLCDTTNFWLAVALCDCMHRLADTADRLYKSNLRLVVHIATYSCYRGLGLDVQDRIQAGNEGLQTAASKWDARLGHFPTYAGYWIKQQIQRAIVRGGSVIRPSFQLLEQRSKYRSMKRALDRVGEALCDKRFADKLGVSLRRFREIVDFDNSVISLDSPVGEEDGESIGDFLTAPDQLGTDAGVQGFGLREALESLLERLPSVEKEVLVRLFGFGGFEAQKWQDVAKALRVTPQRIGQIRQEAIARLLAEHGKELLDISGRDALPARNHGAADGDEQADSSGSVVVLHRRYGSLPNHIDSKWLKDVRGNQLHAGLLVMFDKTRARGGHQVELVAAAEIEHRFRELNQQQQFVIASLAGLRGDEMAESTTIAAVLNVSRPVITYVKKMALAKLAA